MKFDLAEYLTVLSPKDRVGIERHLLVKKKGLLNKYNMPGTREAYTLFAGTIVLRDTYKFIKDKIESMLGSVENLTVLDLGIGEGFMWNKILSSLQPSLRKRIGIVGIDFSHIALKHLKKNLSGFSLNGLEIIRADMNELDLVKLNLNPDVVISSLALHHLNMREKVKIINGIKKSFDTKLMLSEVDFNLEAIEDIRLRNYAASLLYRDVFDTIRSIESQKNAELILHNFYYDEFLNILKSDNPSLEERYIPLSEWMNIMRSANIKLTDIRITLTGINNIYRIGIIEGRT
ncbi:MAG: class I SAM-dependent methyltransferase [Deltaproteobacteria bacterium]|nr:class I SAM-dependent methyltransferase [Deltaproteobacteria bacterium]